MHLFDTALGTCGVAWGPRGLAAVQLPEASADDVAKRLSAHAPGAVEADPPRWVRELVDAMKRHFEGRPERFEHVALDLDAVPPFHRKIYVAARDVAAGETVSYGELAKRIGSAGAARAVGQAMAKNPWPLVVPCHRVLAARGRAGGFSSYGGVVTKARLLELERVRLEGTFQPSLTPRIGDPNFDGDAVIRALSSQDPRLGELIARVGPFTMQRDGVASVYEALARAVVFQQLTGQAAETIYQRVVALSGTGSLATPAELLAIDPTALRGAGLSNAKLLALRDLAEKTLSGVIPSLADAEQLDDDALIERLTAVRGIGRWTVEMLLMFRLGRADVMPASDFGVRNGMRLAYRMRAMPSEAQVMRRAARWRPYRSVASWYLWRAVDLAKREAQ